DERHGAGVRVLFLESPLVGDVEGVVAYPRRWLRDCLQRGEAPLASHLLYTQTGVLDDGIAAERALGIQAGFRVEFGSPTPWWSIPTAELARACVRASEPRRRPEFRSKGAVFRVRQR